jgi:hypothetical protein
MTYEERQALEEAYAESLSANHAFGIEGTHLTHPSVQDQQEEPPVNGWDLLDREIRQGLPVGSLS